MCPAAMNGHAWSGDSRSPLSDKQILAKRKEGCLVKMTVSKPLDRRTLLKFGLLGAGGLTLAACSSGASSSSASTGSKGTGSATGSAPLYKGGTFDAKGATLRLALWGGPFETYAKRFVLDKFEKDFNCKVSQDTSFPWTPKFVASGIQNPPYDLANWNLPDLAQAAKAGDFFVAVDELKRNLPEADSLWPFAFVNGRGVTWVYTQYGYAYRKDKVPAPTSFKSFWDKTYSGGRATFATNNTLEMVFFLTASSVFGNGQKDTKAGYEAMKRAMPITVSPFTGNMQSSLASGNVTIAVLDDGDAYNTLAGGAPLGFYYWKEKKPILTQTFTVSKHSKPLQQKLAYALVNRFCEADFLDNFNAKMFQRPTNKKAKMPSVFEKLGVHNTADQIKGLWIPDWDWFVGQEGPWSQQVNSIFGQ